MPTSTDPGDPNTQKEAMSRPNGHLWKMSAISDLNNFQSRKALIPIQRIKVKSKSRKPVTVKWLFNSKEYPEVLF